MKRQVRREKGSSGSVVWCDNKGIDEPCWEALKWAREPLAWLNDCPWISNEQSFSIPAVNGGVGAELQH